MRALHLFPFFDDRLDDGARHYAFMISKELATAGVEVEVLTTTADRIRHTSAMSHRWNGELPAGSFDVGGVAVHRSPVTASIPSPAGRLISGLIRRRWRREGIAAGGAAGVPDVDVLVRAARERPAAYDWLALLARGPHSFGLLRSAARRARHADVIVAGFLPFTTPWYAMQLAERFHRPFVLLPLLHPRDPYHHFRPFYECFARAGAVLVQTPYAAELSKQLAPGSRPMCIGAGVDPEEWAGGEVSGARFRARHGLGDQRLVLFVGRKEAGKRYDMLVQAVDSLDDPNVRLVMVGADTDGLPLRSSRGLFLGPLSRSELLDAYDACDVFASASEQESFGIVFLEAWMREKPVLGNRACGPVAALVRDAVDGYLCGGVPEFAARIRQLLSDDERARALGRAGRERTLAEYTWQAAARRVREVYEALSGSWREP